VPALVLFFISFFNPAIANIETHYDSFLTIDKVSDISKELTNKINLLDKIISKQLRSGDTDSYELGQLEDLKTLYTKLIKIPKVEKCDITQAKMKHVFYAKSEPLKNDLRWKKFTEIISKYCELKTLNRPKNSTNKL